jgi:hypothetical protein
MKIVAAYMWANILAEFLDDMVDSSVVSFNLARISSQALSRLSGHTNG